MHKYMTEIWNYLQYKILLGLIATIFSDDFFRLLTVFIILECLDIFTRWLAQSRKCFKAIYPQTECNLWRAFTFMWEARKWRYIRSTGLRDGFCSKMLLYLLLLLTASCVDAALKIGNAPKVLTTIVVIVLSSTEALSIMENLAECKVEAITAIKDRFKDKLKVG